ncbi:hypothetical protein GGX14DRAFT_558227 [Mycena pura]|uniref:Uncharacterized protein n=1 Tax=Mycena pura TaxID=153505 RepID=A0AAD6VT60_9AGAR|nr:hypothetical protein GGX14DRAFT_558227 [Mycena pura]
MLQSRSLLVLAWAATTFATLQRSPSARSSSSSGLVDASDCPPKDRNSSSLLTSENLKDGFVECDYKTAGECVYFVNGGFSSGGSVCPPFITSSSQSTSTTSSSQLTSTVTGTDNQSSGGATESGLVDASDCPPKDRNSSSLLTSENLKDGFVECDYKTAGECVYFVNGGFSSGGSVCPPFITSSSQSTSTTSSSKSTSTTSSSQSTSTATGTDNQSSGGATESGFVDASDCPPKDRNSSSLLTSENLKDGFVECDYKTAGECVYFVNGGFSSGGSVCPPSISSTASGIFAVADLADNVSGSSGGSSSGSNGTPTSVLIALLVINGVLVVGILTLLALYARDRRPAAAAAGPSPRWGHSGWYAKVDNADDDVPVALLSGGYYDPHQKP